jgi:dipeptidyl aminopeptidase/acylaminoacyl peptidase
MDGRVPIQHAKAMQSAMKKAGHPADFISYDWEGHGLSDPKDEQDFYGRLLGFLQANLQPQAAGH